MNTPSPQPSDAVSLPLLWEALIASGDIRRAEWSDLARRLSAVEQGLASDAACPVVTRDLIKNLLLPLAAAALHLTAEGQRRVLIGITGGAGSGKTVLSNLLCQTLNALSNPDAAIAMSTDAYHFPNAYLDSHVHTADGIPQPLRQMKGLPPTFDTNALLSDLRRLRTAEDAAISLPIYDRERHDPVPGVLGVRPTHRIIVLEGLHLLRPEAEWRDIRNSLDFCILLDVPLETCRRRVTTRKLAAGRTTEDVQAHFERVDRPTLEAVGDPRHRAQADLIISLDEERDANSVAQSLVLGCERRAKTEAAFALRAVPDGALHLLAIGLNPALQKTMVFEQWDRGQVNRAIENLTSVGGKGQQFSRAASHLIPGMVSLAQFLGGENGERIGRMLDQAGVHQLTVTTSGETRCCVTVIDRTARDATELIEPSATIRREEADELLSKAMNLLQRGLISGLALCGTYPPGVDESFYVRLAQAKGNATLLLDSYRNIDAVLATGQVDILKVNAHELSSLADKIRREKLLSMPERPSSTPDDALTLFETFQLRRLAVTAGPDTAWLFERPEQDSSSNGLIVWQFYEFHLPTIEDVVNPIGAGDTVGAIFLSQLIAGAPPHEAFACGLAAGSASCRQWGGADFDLSDLRTILAAIRVSHVTRRWTIKIP
jgi:fructose-1-phosphate kinase PfkB-like protein/pantothenate kinase